MQIHSSIINPNPFSHNLPHVRRIMLFAKAGNVARLFPVPDIIFTANCFHSRRPFERFHQAKENETKFLPAKPAGRQGNVTWNASLAWLAAMWCNQQNYTPYRSWLRLCLCACDCEAPLNNQIPFCSPFPFQRAGYQFFRIGYCVLIEIFELFRANTELLF